MPTVILAAQSTREINDALAVRYQLLNEHRVPLGKIFHTSGRAIDPVDVYPETLNLVSYVDGKAVGTLRASPYRAGESLFRGHFDFSAAADSVDGSAAYLDWLGVISGAKTPQPILFRLLEFALLMLARNGVRLLVGEFPASFLELLRDKVSVQKLVDASISGDAGALWPGTIDVQSWYRLWVSKIRDREILRFQELFYFTVFEPGEVLFVQGETGSTAYLIQEGEVEIVLQKGEQIIPIAAGGDSQLVGEIAMITQEPRTASLIARTRVSCIAIDRKAFLQALDKEPHLSMDIFKIFSKRISEANRRIAESKGHA